MNQSRHLPNLALLSLGLFLAATELTPADFPALPPVPTRATGEDLMFAVTRPDSVEMAQGDPALLDLLPGGVGFIGDGEDRRLVWLAGDATFPAAGP